VIPFGRLLGCSQLAGGAVGQRPVPLPAQLTHNAQKIRHPTIQNSSPNQAELDSVPGLNPPGPGSRILPIDLLAVGRQVCPYEFFCHTCNRPFSKTLTPTEGTEGYVVCPHCGRGAEMGLHHHGHKGRWSRSGYYGAIAEQGSRTRATWVKTGHFMPQGCSRARRCAPQRLAAGRSLCQQRS
jgi:DNA-directed RNA polymerase subunit RPC12/RpoP